MIFLGHHTRRREAVINMVNQSFFYKPTVNYTSFTKVIVLKSKFQNDFKVV